MPGKTVILDANLMVLLVVGTASRSYIAKHKKLKAYGEEDFTLLVDFLSRESRVIVTPNTVAETSNIAGSIPQPMRTDIYKALRNLLSDMHETYIGSHRAASDPIFSRLGITDAALLNIVTTDHILLTADLDLYLEATRRGHRAVNFNHHIEANR